MSIDEKIGKQKVVVATAKDKYDTALNELNILIKKKQDLQGKELLNEQLSILPIQLDLQPGNFCFVSTVGS